MQGRRILLVGDNFGTGSSREHAPWALRAWGIQAILSTCFADIFRSNALKNGLLPIVVDPATHGALFEMVEREPDAELRVDLAEQGILLPDGSTFDFEIDPFSKMMLIAGTDEIGYVLAKDARSPPGRRRPPGARRHPRRYPHRAERQRRAESRPRGRPAAARASAAPFEDLADTPRVNLPVRPPRAASSSSSRSSPGSRRGRCPAVARGIVGASSPSGCSRAQGLRRGCSA